MVKKKNGLNLNIVGGEPIASGDYDGGNLYLYGGSPHGSGVEGDVYFGTGAEGKLKEADSSITHVVMYDPATGKLSYGTP